MTTYTYHGDGSVTVSRSPGQTGSASVSPSMLKGTSVGYGQSQANVNKVFADPNLGEYHIASDEAGKYDMPTNSFVSEALSKGVSQDTRDNLDYYPYGNSGSRGGDSSSGGSGIGSSVLTGLALPIFVVIGAIILIIALFRRR